MRHVHALFTKHIQYLAGSGPPISLKDNHLPVFKRLYFAVGLATVLSITGTANSTDTSIQEDVGKGQRVFNRCKACHNLTDTSRTRLGPNLDGLFGRKAGSATNFKYSKALKEAEFLWTEAKLDEWLAKPSAFLPGNKMQFAGVRSAGDRKNLIAYLRQVTVKEE